MAVKRSTCPLANTLDIIGDKWTLLVVRDLFLGKRTYNEFIASPEGMRTNTLADRLRKLEAIDIITKVPYQQKPLRYTYNLTEKGQALSPVIRAMVSWGSEYVSGSQTQPADRHSDQVVPGSVCELVETE